MTVVSTLLWLSMLANADVDPLRLMFKHAHASPQVRTDGKAPSMQPGWDVDHYDIHVQLDPSAETVTGQIDIKIKARINNPSILFLHAQGPDIDSIHFDETEEATWTLEEPRLEVDVPMSIAAGEYAQVRVNYTVDAGSFEEEGPGLIWGEPIFSFHEPIGARRWLVVFDDPADKASLNWHIRMPSSYTVIANGVPDEPQVHDDGTTTSVFRFAEPIATYLMVLHAGDYEHHVDEGGPVAVHTWAHPSLFDEAVSDFANTSDMISYFSDLWVDYPWTHYANVTAPFGGAMEHTTATTFGEGLIGRPRAELVNAHEIGHHWWGDLITLAEWPEIWLNEGFATYSEALWVEHALNEQAFHSYLDDQRRTYFDWQEYEGISSLYDPDYMWGGLVYDKGSLVVHMLRVVIGDEAFFEGLQLYAMTHAHDVATTDDLRAAMESVHEGDLGWFFDQWVYQAGDPEYIWGITNAPLPDGIWQTDLHIQQVGEGSWTMPVEVDLILDDGTHHLGSTWSTDGTVTESFCLPSPAVGADFDPRVRLLYAHEYRRDSTFEAASEACGDDLGTEEEEEDDSGQEDTAVTSGIDSSTDGIVANGKLTGCGCQASTLPRGMGWLLFGLASLVSFRRFSA